MDVLIIESGKILNLCCYFNYDLRMFNSHLLDDDYVLSVGDNEEKDFLDKNQLPESQRKRFDLIADGRDYDLIAREHIFDIYKEAVLVISSANQIIHENNLKRDSNFLFKLWHNYNYQFQYKEYSVEDYCSSAWALWLIVERYTAKPIVDGESLIAINEDQGRGPVTCTAEIKCKLTPTVFIELPDDYTNNRKVAPVDLPFVASCNALYLNKGHHKGVMIEGEISASLGKNLRLNKKQHEQVEEILVSEIEKALSHEGFSEPA